MPFRSVLRPAVVLLLCTPFADSTGICRAEEPNRLEFVPATPDEPMAKEFSLEQAARSLDSSTQARHRLAQGQPALQRPLVHADLEHQHAPEPAVQFRHRLRRVF